MSITLQRGLVREMAASTGIMGGSRILGASLQETNCGHMHEGIMRAGGEKSKKSKYVK
jgi:hypothetical protein